MNGFLGFFGLATLASKQAVASALASERKTSETLRTKLRDCGQEYADYIAATEDRFHAIAALETPKANATVRKMARLARSAHQ